MRIFLSALLLSAAPVAVLAQDNVYTVGEVQVTAQDREGRNIGGAVVSGETLNTYAKESIDNALDLIPGANAGNSGGSRNERLVFIRGFDRFQTTLSIDGVRVFLPADNRIDFARFLTADLSEVQVSKGYVSVMDGPGGMGGAINLVTLKPVKSFEGDVQYGLFLDRNGDEEGQQISARFGGNTGELYWQISGALNDRDRFTLSNDFTPTPLEDGGTRGNSATRDTRLNIKLGWTPNSTDEYSLNYNRQEGSKNAPYSVTDTASTRFWSWPYWDTATTSLLTRTQLRDDLVVRTRLYQTTFDNLLSSFDNAVQTLQTLPRAFNSYYADTATGGNVSLTYDLDTTSQIKGAFYVRRDVHHERQDGFTRVPATGSPSANRAYSEPWQTNDEYTYSLASEYTTGIGENVDLVVGASYDWTDLKTANDVNLKVTGTTIANSVISFDSVNYPLINQHALNGQAAVVWHVSPDTRVHFTVSDRTRFPTVFERFSSRMGTAFRNPSIKAERAINFEIGSDTALESGATFSGAVFYSEVQDALFSVTVPLSPADAALYGVATQAQYQNVGDGRYYGVEGAFEAPISDTVTLGANATYTHRTLVNPKETQTLPDAIFHPTGVPDFKAFAYVNWTPTDRLTIRPNIEWASSRYTQQTQAIPTGSPLKYYRTGAYVLSNLSADYKINETVTLRAAVQNLMDENYQLTDGFPEAGRSYFVSARASF